MDSQIQPMLDTFVDLIVQVVYRGFSTENSRKLFDMLDNEDNWKEFQMLNIQITAMYELAKPFAD